MAAHASKPAAVSYQRAGEVVAQLDWEVEPLLAQAETADATPLEAGLKIPDEIVRRQERTAAWAKARAEIEARAQARYAAQLAEPEQQLAERHARQDRGEKAGGGSRAQGPRPEPQPKAPYHFTDSESRIHESGPWGALRAELPRAGGGGGGEPVDSGAASVNFLRKRRPRKRSAC